MKEEYVLKMTSVVVVGVSMWWHGYLVKHVVVAGERAPAALLTS